jgi:Tfp pilus assembly protein PilN
MSTLSQFSPLPAASAMTGWREQARALAGDGLDLVTHGWGLLTGRGQDETPVPDRLVVLGACGRLGLWRGPGAAIAWIDDEKPGDAGSAGQEPARGRLDSQEPATGRLASQELGRWAHGDAPIGLAISDELVLGLTVPLPQGPRRLLDLVLSNRAAAESPFSADATLAAWRIQPQGEQRVGELCLFPAERLRPALASLAAAGIAISSIVPLDGDRKPLWACRPHWLNDGQSAPRRGRGSLLVKLLLMAGLAFAALSLSRLGWLSWQLSDLAPRADRAQAETRRIASLRADGALLLREQRRALRIVATLDDLAQKIPDGAWLTEMTLDGDGLRLAGAAPSAADVLSLVDACPTLRAAALQAAVARDAGKGLERFRIGAKLRQDTP